MNHINLVPRTSARLAKDIIALSTKEVDTIIDALHAWSSALANNPDELSSDETHQILYNAEGELNLEAMENLADRLVTRRLAQMGAAS